MTQAYTKVNYCPSDNLGYLLKRCGTLIAITVDRSLAEFGMTHAQLGIFLRLVSGSAKTASELARELITDTGSMTRMLDRLEEKQFIERSRDGEDRRVVRVRLTSKGERLADQMKGVAIASLNQHLRGFSAAETTQLKDFLQRMIANAEP
jgi:DNA-binding MarR family transcriptional regulator